VLTTWCDVEKIIHKLGSDPQGDYDHEIQRIQKIAGQDRIEVQKRFAMKEEIASSNKSRDERAADMKASKSAEETEMAKIDKRLHLEHTTADSALADSKSKQNRAGKVKTQLRTMLATQYR
jgi:hypothetical protein